MNKKKETTINFPIKYTLFTVGIGDRFGGIGTSSDESDHFKLLAADGDSLLVGARYWDVYFINT